MLYVVGTPIGNLGDMTLRGLETLKNVDFICAEDTRVTAKLLSHFEIKKPLISYFEHNKMERGPQIVEKLRNGENGAIVTDAGMPGISDPGEHLIGLCREAGIPYTVVPGPVAFVTGAVLSGLPTKEILFLGFLPENKKDAAPVLDKIKRQTGTVVLYESPYNLLKTLKLLAENVPDRTIALTRELTKIHEEVIRGTAEELLLRYEEENPRGEYVVVIGGGSCPPAEEDGPAPDPDSDEFREALCAKILQAIDNGQKRNEAVKNAAKEMGISRNLAYGIFENRNGEDET